MLCGKLAVVKEQMDGIAAAVAAGVCKQVELQHVTETKGCGGQGALGLWDDSRWALWQQVGCEGARVV
jgi:hypothetical protein